MSSIKELEEIARLAYEEIKDNDLLKEAISNKKLDDFKEIYELLGFTGDPEIPYYYGSVNQVPTDKKFLSFIKRDKKKGNIDNKKGNTNNLFLSWVAKRERIERHQIRENSDPWKIWQMKSVSYIAIQKS